jgi:colanic acid biosynthesis glycosyl transferase WcaI
MRYVPDATGTGPLVTQLAEDLVRYGEEVTVITTLPHYGRSSIHPEYRNVKGFFFQETLNGVKVIRTRVFVPRNPHFTLRLLNYLSYTFLSLLAGLRVKRIDVVLAINPPISTPFSAWFSSMMHQAPLVLGIQDIWPDCIIQVGKLRNPLLVGLSKLLEKIQYWISDKIIVLSNSMKSNLMEKSVNPQKVSVIANWADVEEIQPMPSRNSFSERHDLNNKFVVLFSGNHGHNAGLETVIEAARMSQEDKRLLYLLAGDGNTKNELVSLAKTYGLENILFLPTQPKDDWLRMLGAADIGLVPLRENLGDLNVPSKMYTYMAAGKPVLASVPEQSEIVNIIHEAGCGWIVPPEEPADLYKKIKSLKEKDKLLKEKGKNGRKYIEKNMTRAKQTRAYLDLIHQIS